VNIADLTPPSDLLVAVLQGIRSLSPADRRRLLNELARVRADEGDDADQGAA
jgi:hypothetical protein